MRKYLEFFKEGFPSDMSDRTAIENWPYVGHDVNGGVVYTVIPAKEEPSLYEAVDLGLPSGLKWATMNVGAESPEDAGLYFQWGDTVGYSADQVGKDKVFNWSTYKYCDGSNRTMTKYCIHFNYGKDEFVDLKEVLDLEDDAAHVHMGSEWRMPTMSEFQELIDNTTPTFIDLQGNEFTQDETSNGTIEWGKLKGIRLTGSNGNSIFIPASGHCQSYYLRDIGSYSGLWSSSLCNIDSSFSASLNFSYEGHLVVTDLEQERASGLCVRGVKA